MNFQAAFSAQPKWLIATEMAVGVSLIGFADLKIEWEKSLFVFYGIPVFTAAWWVSRRTAVWIALLAVAVSFLANLDSPYSNHSGFIWAAITRFCYLTFVAIGTSAMRSQSDAKRERIESLTRARAHELEVVRAVEGERIRIGQDLHDGVCQNLAAIDCAAACLRDALEESGSRESALAGKIQQYLQQTIVEARNLARGIVPVQVERDGMISALKELVSHANLVRNGTAYFESSGDVQIEDQQVALHLFRIAQEAMSNAARHASATQIGVTLCAEGADVTLTISDDGRGFDSEANGHLGMGLRTMRYRAKLMGAPLEIASAPGGGTTVRCTISQAAPQFPAAVVSPP